MRFHLDDPGALDVVVPGRVLPLSRDDISLPQPIEFCLNRCVAFGERNALGIQFRGLLFGRRLIALEILDMPSRLVRSRVAEALERVGLAGRGGERTGNLSGGEKQRVAVALAIVTEPALLLADEPTGNLDSKSTHEILDVFTALNDGGRTVVLITHEDDVAARAKRVIRLRDGEIVADERTRSLP